MSDTYKQLCAALQLDLTDRGARIRTLEVENAQLKADLAQAQATIQSLERCQCEGCDESLEGEAYCVHCYMKSQVREK